jgi:hypothetical protein
MNDNVIQDLKQFIAITVHQATSDMATKDDLKAIETKIDDLSNAVAESLDSSNEENQVHIVDYERRITKLESKLA